MDIDIATLLATKHIEQCLYRYGTAVDRRDAPFLKGVFWPEAVIDIEGFYSGPATGFADTILPSMRETMESTAHFITNIRVEISEGTARAESYLCAFHRLKGEDGPRDLILAGRYFDQLTERHGEWRLMKRRLVYDWFREWNDACPLSAGMLGMPVAALGQTSSFLDGSGGQA